VTVGGEGAELPIVFMHGLFLDKTLWLDCGDCGAGRKCIYIDMPAHGASDDVGRDWSV
jgi:pimeloyl-ACP methyl ester carboxylesterase